MFYLGFFNFVLSSLLGTMVGSIVVSTEAAQLLPLADGNFGMFPLCECVYVSLSVS